MKRVLSLVLAFVLIVCLVPTAAFAGEKTDAVQTKVVAAREYLYGAKESFTAAEGYDFLLFQKAGGDGEKFKDAYVQSVKDAFDAGSMTTADRVAIAMSNLKLLGVDTQAFELNGGTTINLEEKMVANGTEVDSAYNYRYVLQNAQGEYAQQVIDAIMAKYTPGRGYDYWGFSTDNTANFGAIMAENGGSDEVLADAVNIVESTNTGIGYYYNEQYGCDANGDSTACALYFYSVLGRKDLAKAAYKALIANFEVGEGAYCFTHIDGADAYATRDVLNALIEYSVLCPKLDNDDRITIVYNKMVAARDHLYGAKETFTAADGLDFMLFLSAGGDGAAYKDAYIQSVKDAFDAGSMTTADRVALAMSNLKLLGENPAAFQLNDQTTVNLEEKMIANGTTVDSPYNYRYVLQNTTNLLYTMQVLAEMMNHYTAGSGYDYWGFSTDNSANFGASIAAVGGSEETVADIANIVEGAKVAEGYYYFADYGTAANGNSTASALYFYAAAGKKDLADTAYDLLTANFDLGSGAYCYELGGADNAYATRDALKALIEYYRFYLSLGAEVHVHNYTKKVVYGAYTAGYTMHTCECGDSYADTYTAPLGKVGGLKCKSRTQAAEAIVWNKVPATVAGYQIQISNAAGNAWATIKATTGNAFVFKNLAAGCNYKFRVRFYTKAADGKYYFSPWSNVVASPTLPAGTTVKVAAAKNAFVAAWGRKAVTGYQIQYSTNAKFAGAKTLTIKNAKAYKYAVKNLKARTNYYVRIRTYKTINKANYFSTWSSLIRVKTK